MEAIELQTQTRDPKAGPPHKLKAQGIIPAELYGHNIPNVHLALSQNEFSKVLRKAGESTIISVQMPDGSKKNALIHDVQRHYLTSEPIHVDLYEISMTEKLTATVPLEFVGESDAVKLLGGTMVKVLSELEVECLPVDLPHTIEVDISSMQTFADTITLGDLKIPAKVEVKGEADELIAKVQPPRNVEEELAVPETEAKLEDLVEGIAENKPEAAEGEDKPEAGKKSEEKK